MHQQENLEPYHHNSGKCPHCNGTDIFHDKDSGEEVCRGCGNVLSEISIDPGKEWREFTQKETESRSRVEVGKDVMNRETWTTFREHETSSVEQKYQFQRMKRESARAALHGSKQRNFSTAKNALDLMCSKLKYEGDHVVKEKAARVYRDSYDKGLVRGRTIEGMVAASILVAWRDLKVSRPIADIAEVSQIQKTDIARNYRLIVNELGIRPGAPNPRARMAKIVGKLDAPPSHEMLADRILVEAQRLKAVGGKSPGGLAAGAFYIASDFLKDGSTVYTQKEIALAADVTEVTIRNRYKGIMNSFEKHGIEIGKLAEGIERGEPARRKKPAAGPSRQGSMDSGYFEQLQKLSYRLDIGNGLKDRARDIYLSALERQLVPSKKKQLLLDTSLTLAMELYDERVCAENLVSNVSTSSKYDIRKLSNRLKRALDLGRPRTDFPKYVDHISGALGLDGDTSDAILKLLREYERDNPDGDADRLSVAAAATRKVLAYFGRSVSLVKIQNTFGVSNGIMYKRTKLFETYDIGSILGKDGK